MTLCAVSDEIISEQENLVLLQSQKRFTKNRKK